MKKSKFKDSQIIGYIKRAEPASRLPRCAGRPASAQPCSTSGDPVRRYGRVDDGAGQELEEENRRLKKMYASPRWTRRS